MHHAPLSKNLFYLLGLYFFLFGAGCRQTPIKTQDEIDKWKEAFVERLPHDQPDVCMQRIKDSLQDPVIQHWACENILFNDFDRLKYGIYVQHIDNIEAFAKAYPLTDPREDLRFKGKIELFRGYKMNEIAKFDSALLHLNRALKIFEQLKDSSSLHFTLARVTAVHNHSGNYIAATEATLKGMTYVGKNDTNNQMISLIDLARCYGKSGEYQRAKPIVLQAIKVAQSTGNPLMIGQGWLDWSRILLRLEEPDSAIWGTQKAKQLFDSDHYTDRNSEVYMNFGLAYKLKRDFQKALENTETARFICDSLQTPAYSAMANNQLANIYQNMGEWQAARKNYQIVAHYLDSTPNPDMKSRIDDSLSVLAFQERNDMINLAYLRASKAYAKKQFSTEKQQIVENMNVKYETAKREEQISTLSLEQKTWQLQRGIAALLLLLGIGVGAALTVRNRQQKALIVKENELLAVKTQAAEVELQANRRELDLFTTNLLSKNQLISDLEDRVFQLSNPPQSYSSKEVPDQTELANMKILTDQDWKAYLKHFTAVYKDFIGRIERDLPNLSTAELRMCLLLKQGFDTKTMADVLGISVAGIKKSRHRLRKKLNLEEDANLEAFVQEL